MKTIIGNIKEMLKEKKGEKVAGHPSKITTDEIVGTTNTATPPLVKDLDYGRTATLYNEKLLKKRCRIVFITIPRTQQDINELMINLKKTSKNVISIIISKELHKDGTPHIHIVIKFNNTVYIRQIYNQIIATEGVIGGAINFVNNISSINATIQYVKKDGNYIEYHEPLKLSKKIDNTYEHHSITELLKIINDNDKSIEENLEIILMWQPRYYLEHHNQILRFLENKKNKKLKEWIIPSNEPESINLNQGQQKIWQLINIPPKPRRIIWITGKPGTGKSFLMNYIQQNYSYGMYNAGACSSMDSVIYGYNQQGVIAWDIPKNFDFEKLGNNLACVVEKFSDFGQRLTSKKYTGKDVIARGHVLVFSNHEPLEQLEHREIVTINLDNNNNLYNKFDIKSPYFEYESDIDTSSTSSQLTYEGPDIGYN